MKGDGKRAIVLLSGFVVVFAAPLVAIAYGICLAACFACDIGKKVVDLFTYRRTR